jgi:hypothetical protein
MEPNCMAEMTEGVLPRSHTLSQHLLNIASADNRSLHNTT